MINASRQNQLQRECSYVTYIIPKTLSGRIFAVVSVALAISVFAYLVKNRGPKETEFEKKLSSWADCEKTNNPIANTDEAVCRIKACQLSNNRSLNLSGLHLKTVPSVIGKLNFLKDLNLSFNKLTTLPMDMRNLKSLTGLHLSYNSLKSLPDWIGELQNLIWLDLVQNQLERLPCEINNLKKLATLNLDMNDKFVMTESLFSLPQTSIVKINFIDPEVKIYIAKKTIEHSYKGPLFDC